LLLSIRFKPFSLYLFTLYLHLWLLLLDRRWYLPLRILNNSRNLCLIIDITADLFSFLLFLLLNDLLNPVFLYCPESSEYGLLLLPVLLNEVIINSAYIVILIIIVIKGVLLLLLISHLLPFTLFFISAIEIEYLVVRKLLLVLL
jgi:hypothetical protein